MLRTAIAAILVAAATVAVAANTESRAELSQAKARTVLDQAVEANGGAERSEERRVGKEWRTRRAEDHSSRRRHTRFDCDWSSDVCSSDLAGIASEPVSTESRHAAHCDRRHPRRRRNRCRGRQHGVPGRALAGESAHRPRPGRRGERRGREIGRASCRERVENSAGGGSFKQKTAYEI